MCLQTVDEENKATKWKTGYKVVCRSIGGEEYMPEFRFSGRAKHCTYPVGKWLSEEDYRPDQSIGMPLIEASDSTLYPKGFHVFRTEVAARDWALPTASTVTVKVAVAEPLASGTQVGSRGRIKTGIFRKIKVLKEVA